MKSKICLIILISSCAHPLFRIKTSDQKLLLFKDKLVIDSIALFTDSHLEYRLLGNNLYYTDNLITPGRLNLNLYKVEIENDKFGHPLLSHLGSYDMDYWLLERIKIKKNEVLLKVTQVEEGLTTTKKFSLDSLFGK